MARTYTDGLDEVTAAFPGAVADLGEWLNERTDRDEVVEEFTVPAAPDADGRYRVELDHMISEADTVVIVCDGDTLTQIPYGVTPGAGEVAVAYGEIPVLEFHSSRASEDGTSTHTPLGTALSSARMNEFAAELMAVQEAVGGTRERIAFYVHGAPETGRILGARRLPAWAAGRTITRITVSAESNLGVTGSGGDATTMAVSSQTTPGSIVHNTNGVVATPLLGNAGTWHTTLVTNWAVNTASEVTLYLFCTATAAGWNNISVELWVE